MGFFSRKDRDAGRDVGADIERAKREGSEQRWVTYVHNDLEDKRAAQPQNTGRNSARPSGPSCKSASTRKRGRRW